MPADPQVGPAWLNEADVAEVEAGSPPWAPQPYVVFSRSMAAYATTSDPAGYTQLASAIGAAPGGRSSTATLTPLSTAYMR